MVFFESELTVIGDKSVFKEKTGLSQALPAMERHRAAGLGLGE